VRGGVGSGEEEGEEEDEEREEEKKEEAGEEGRSKSMPSSTQTQIRARQHGAQGSQVRVRGAPQRPQTPHT
jgi:hypothetical protein